MWTESSADMDLVFDVDQVFDVDKSSVDVDRVFGRCGLSLPQMWIDSWKDVDRVFGSCLIYACMCAGLSLCGPSLAQKRASADVTSTVKQVAVDG